LSIDVAVTADLVPFHYAERNFISSLCGSAGLEQGPSWSDIRNEAVAVCVHGLYNPRVGQALPILAITAVIFASAPLELGTRDQALTRLFTPIAVPPGTYVVYTSTETIEVLTARLRERDGSPAPGAWEPTRPEAHGAFGQEGAYDRARLARLFNGKRVTVVRGSFVDSGQRLAYTLVSPYPDATLSRIVSGTMVIEFRVPPLE
jgi:hypothetical protein